MATALTFRVKSVFIDAIQSCLEKTGLSVNAALKEIIASAIRLNHRRSNVPRNNLAEHPKRFKCVFENFRTLKANGIPIPHATSTSTTAGMTALTPESRFPRILPRPQEQNRE